ncbi:Fe(3+) ABC transporter substrate-binding protein [Gracilimonas mengyeensis]|uniref:Iron(III) transport system substrate-binding protein n=1 Tax=Gracilimonas mengyeensis TaxID=1302730 RepID=A0A521AUJ7_9BACT|nr:Fe(3+) ABC transporter substrate-binding protein [Gracilimonas mengyeensis]SMO38484.1 iron(III) transport system substrate-binding protein [Gracilimonas mengyeensis]
MKSTLLSLFAVAMLFMSCSSQEEVNVYSARHYDTDQQLYDEFTEKTGIEVNLIEGGSDELIERVRSEGINSPADILITVDAGRLWRAEEADILQSFESDVINERVPSEFRHPDGLWIGLSKRVRGLVVNPDAVENHEELNYEDLAEPRFEGRVCVRSSNNIYNQSLIASMVETIGAEATEEWATGLVNNFARDPQGGDRDQIRAVAAGVCDVAIANHYYLAVMITGGDEADQEAASQVEFVFPNQGEDERGAHINISGAGILKNSPNKQNAVRFLEYLTTEDAQKYFISGNNEYPINDDAEIAEVLQSFGEYKSDAVNVSALGRNNPEAIQIMDRAGWQ